MSANQSLNSTYSAAANDLPPQLLQQVLESSPMGVIVTQADETGRVLLVNPPAAQIFSLLPDALVGQAIRDVAGSESLERLLVSALEPTQETAGEIILGDAGAPHAYIRAVIVHGRYAGQPALFWWINDVTLGRRAEEEWKRRERQLQAVIDAAQDAVFEILLSTGDAVVSPRFWEMLGFDAKEAQARQQTSSEGIYHFIREDRQLDFAASMALPMQDGPYEWTGPARKTDGSDVWLYMRDRFTDVHGEGRIIGVITDISAQKVVEESLRQAKESAEEANRAKSSFLATMSHEIRTPMTAILGGLEYLLDTPLVKDQSRMVTIARESGQALLAILNDILDLSKIEAGKLTLESMATSPRLLVQGACDAAQIVARQKGIGLRCTFTQPPPALVLLDPVRVRQVLMNFVNNAVKFTESGDVTVTAGIEEKADQQAVLRVSVRDTGIGMTPEQMKRLFKPFSQADGSTTRKFGGTGLGLSICARLVERMGGEIAVKSIPGAGSTFSFWIPVQISTEKVTSGQEISLKDYSVLLLDSNRDALEQAAEMLLDVGARVAAVTSPREAILQLGRSQVTLVILEQVLDGMRGLELVPALRALQPDLRVLLFTDSEPDTIAWTAQQAGVFYLPRSAPYLQFMETVKSLASGGAKIRPAQGGELKGKVLIAEDTAAVRQILEVQVRGMGVEVEFAENGLQALEKLQKGHYSMVISDLHMPELDGYGLVKEWRSREEKRGKGEHLPIVALTADVLIGDASKFIAEGFDDYMAKPVSRDGLRKLISKWLNTGAEQHQEVVPVVSPVPLASGDAPIDHARLLDILGIEDEEIIRESMDVFILTAEETFAALQKAYDQGNAEAAKGPAHSLKGSARMAGAVLLGDIAAELDAAAKQGQLLPERLQACADEQARVLAYVRKRYLAPSLD